MNLTHQSLFSIWDIANRTRFADNFCHQNEDHKVNKENQNDGCQKEGEKRHTLRFDKAHRVSQITVVCECYASHCMCLRENEVSDERYW